MRKSTFTEEQIAYALRQAESGTPVLEVCRKLGVSEQTFYRWKRKFAGMGDRRAAAAAPARRREPPAQAAGRGSDLGSAHAARGHPKKAVKPAQQKPLVDFVRVGFARE